MDSAQIEVLFNPKCSKCRQAKALLDERNLEYRLIPYLEEPPSPEDLLSWCQDLGLDHPRGMMRQKDALFTELGMAEADANTAIEAMAAQPQLIERPIVRRGGRAVIARPPELLLDILA